MKLPIKHMALTGVLFAAFAAGPAQAHEDRSCFSQKTVSGWIKICSEHDGGFALNLGSYGERRDRDDRRERHDDDHQGFPHARAVPVAYYYPAGAYYFVPPGHYKHQAKHHRHHHHKNHGDNDRRRSHKDRH